LEKCALEFEPPPGKEKFIQMVQLISEAAKSVSKVEVPFNDLSERQDLWWQGDASREVRFPIGQLGAKRYQEMSLNGDQEPDALVIGKVGFGKSNLLQVMIDSLITRYSPQEVVLYLLDLKQVTFEVYAAHRIPHAKVIAIKTEVEFALSVLKRLEQELSVRKDLFTAAGELDLAGYRKGTGETLPRVFLFIDEFQDLFYEDSSARLAENILENLVREGRSFGIHIILASQTLRGQHTLPNVIKDLIPIRIALQCADADARLILSDDNSEAFLLERPGEAIYNDINGRVEGNSRFQTFWLDKDERKDFVRKVAAFASLKGFSPDPSQIIFDGRADSSLAENYELGALLKAYPPTSELETHLAWIGGPVEIKPHPNIRFHRSAGKNAILSGGDQDKACILAMVSSMLISLAAQYPSGRSNYVIGDFLELDHSKNYLSDLIQKLGLSAKIISTQREIELYARQLSKLLGERDKTADHKSFPDIHFIVLGLQNIRRLRSEMELDDGQESLSSVVLRLCSQGPELGIFTIAYCDNLRNFERGLGRSALDDFDLRIGLQMSPEDSRRLFESEKASELGPQRGLCLDVNRNNTPEKFRPYALPELSFLSQFKNQ
jgi:hypothetical protein